jgi:hypothetical protein
MLTSETAVSRNLTKQPAIQSEVQEAAIPKQLNRLEPPSEKMVKKVEENVANAFEACARTRQQWDYVKTETGFVLCEGFSFDARARR